MGDLVLMSMLAFNAAKENSVTIFHPYYKQYQALFSHFTLLHPDDYDPKEYELTIVQNDHSKYAYRFQEIRQSNPTIRFLFPKPSALFRPNDFLFDQSITFMENLKSVAEALFRSSVVSNGLFFSDTPFRLYKKEVLIHPMSKSEKKIWPIHKFLKIYRFLLRQGYDPKFIMTEEERVQLNLENYSILSTPTLLDLAKRIKQTGFFIGCDSGPGHLASSLQIPTLTLFPNPKIGKVWRPCYSINVLATPPFKIPRIGNSAKWNALDFLWHRMITVSQVERKFLELVEKAQNPC